MRGLLLRQDAATGLFSFETDAYHPADGIKVAALDAQGHSTYYTAAMQACPAQLLCRAKLHLLTALQCTSAETPVWQRHSSSICNARSCSFKCQQV